MSHTEAILAHGGLIVRELARRAESVELGLNSVRGSQAWMSTAP